MNAIEEDPKWFIYGKTSKRPNIIGEWALTANVDCCQGKYVAYPPKLPLKGGR